MNTSTIALTLGNYCNVLRDDGMGYGESVEQLTYLLFLNMADERSRPPWLPARAACEFRTRTGDLGGLAVEISGFYARGRTEARIRGGTPLPRPRGLGVS